MHHLFDNYQNIFPDDRLPGSLPDVRIALQISQKQGLMMFTQELLTVLQQEGIPLHDFLEALAGVCDRASFDIDKATGQIENAAIEIDKATGYLENAALEIYKATRKI